MVPVSGYIARAAVASRRHGVDVRVPTLPGLDRRRSSKRLRRVVGCRSTRPAGLGRAHERIPGEALPAVLRVVVGARKPARLATRAASVLRVRRGSGAPGRREPHASSSASPSGKLGAMPTTRSTSRPRRLTRSRAALRPSARRPRRRPRLENGGHRPGTGQRPDRGSPLLRVGRLRDQEIRTPLHVAPRTLGRESLS